MYGQLSNMNFEYISEKPKKGSEVKYLLHLYNPEEVYNALTQNHEIINWLKYISNHYLPPTNKVLLIYPCSAVKPYYKSQSYKQLNKTLSSLGEQRKNIHLATISEPFGVIPEEFLYKETWMYDCPGLFEWWCKKNNEPYSKEYVDKSIDILANYTSIFLKKVEERKSYSKIVAFVRTFSSNLERRDDHTHRRIIEEAVKISRVKVEILPPKRVVKSIVKQNGHFAWDMYGVAHPQAQRYLGEYLKGCFHGINL